MNDHSELLKTARKLDDVIADVLAKLCKLADIVEAYDKAESEAVAACRTCDDVIADVLANAEEQPSDCWIDLCAAGHLAKRAVELMDKAKGGA